MGEETVDVAPAPVPPVVAPTIYTISDKDRAEIENIYQYHAPKGDQAARYVTLREAAKTYEITIRTLCPQSRERSIALTHIMESNMAANAAIARNE